MTERQARVCVYCAATSLGMSIITLVIVVLFAMGFQQSLYNQSAQQSKEISGLAKWSVAIYEKLDASGCIVTKLPRVPTEEK